MSVEESSSELSAQQLWLRAAELLLASEAEAEGEGEATPSPPPEDRRRLARRRPGVAARRPVLSPVAMPCLRTSRARSREVASPLGSRSGPPRQVQARRPVKAPPSQRREAPLLGEVLRVAASQGELSELSRFMELGYELDAPEGGVDGKAAWIRRGCPKLNVDAPDESGYTALMKAAANGNRSLTITLSLRL